MKKIIQRYKSWSLPTKIFIWIGIIGIIINITVIIWPFNNSTISFNEIKSDKSPVVVNSSNVNISYGDTVNFNPTSLDKTEREFFETIKERFGCHLDDGIICNIRHLNVFNPNGNVIKNVLIELPIGNNIYKAFLKEMGPDLQTIGYCSADNTVCKISPQYLPENNKIKPCYYVKAFEFGTITTKIRECD